MPTSTTIFPQKPTARNTGILPHHLLPKSVRRDFDTLQRLAGISSRHPGEVKFATSTHDTLWREVRAPISLRTEISPPPRDLSSLGILNKHDLLEEKE